MALKEFSSTFQESPLYLSTSKACENPVNERLHKQLRTFEHTENAIKPVLSSHSKEDLKKCFQDG